MKSLERRQGMLEAKKEVLVTDKNERVLSRTTKDRAKRLVSRGRAKWVGRNHILLLTNYKEQRKIQRKIEEEAGRTCYICGEVMQAGDLVTIDHVIPKNIGGKDEVWNLRCCCFRCNKDKGCQPIRGYVKRIKRNRKDYHYISDQRLKELGDFVQTFYQDNLL